MTIQQILQLAKERLTPLSDCPLLEAEIMLAHALKKPRSYLRARPEQYLDDEIEQRFMQYIARRCNQEPIAYITEVREFWSMELAVSVDTLIPRPETELLVETALNLFPADQAISVADLGTGSGAIALALARERPLWGVYATDLSEKALVIAKQNAQAFGLQNVAFFCGDWCAALPHRGFDIVISNPPYIAETEWVQYARDLHFEPHMALVSGADGLNALRMISQSAKDYLRLDGYLVVEHGFSQAKAVREIFLADKYTEIHTKFDLAGQERITLGVFSP